MADTPNRRWFLHSANALWYSAGLQLKGDMQRSPNTIGEAAGEATASSEAAGPASPAAFSERRRFKRTNSFIRARLFLADERCDGVVLDVSVNGVKMRLDVPPALGAPVSLALAGSVHFGGEVAWRQGNTIGITFMQRPEQLAELMTTLLPGQGPAFGHA